jgi:hypothetical protein
MQRIILLSLTLLLFIGSHAQQQRFNIFTYTPPTGFAVKKSAERILLEKVEGNKYCQLYLWKAINSNAGAEQNFKNDWAHFVTTPYKVGEPAQKKTGQVKGWEVITGAATGQYGNASLTTVVATYTAGNTSYCINAVFNDMKYAGIIGDFIERVEATNQHNNPATPVPPVNGNSTGSMNISIATTNFNDGWSATPKTDYVQVTKQQTEIRLYYVNTALENSRPNTVDPPEFYWSNIIAPAFNAGSPEKWSGVQYPVIYFMQGDAVDKQTGKRCFVAMKVIYEGGARVVVTVTPDRSSYEQQFPHPNDLNRMLNYNKFAVTTKDVLGTWTKNGGGGVEYYDAYTGNYAGMSALSTSDEFVFTNNGSYQSTHNSANMNSGGTKFAAIKYNGKYTVSNWELMATNRVSGKTKKFWCQLEAVKGGYLLILTDSDYEPLRYVLFRKQ